MSDNLIIREDGVGRLIRGVDALEIKLQNGGTSRWVRFNPRDQKSVNANGEYHATDDGVDGYRTITVNVPTRTQSQTPGRDQEIFNPDTGTVYYTDDEGMLHEELLPTEIRIMHVPDKTTYQDGEQIDLEGIVVQAYRGGEVWTSAQYPDGYIPVHELTIAPEIAQYTGKNPFIEKDDYRFYSYGRIAGEGYYKGGQGGQRMPPIDIQFIPFEGTLLNIYQNKYRYQDVRWRYAIFQGIMYGKDLNFDNPPPTKELGYIIQNGVIVKTIIGGRINPLLNPYYRKPFYSAYSDLYREFYTGTVGYNAFDFVFDPEIQSASGGGHDGEAAYDILYGEDEPEKKTTSKVSVSWQRPKDGKTLLASFEITVEAAS